SAGGYSPVTSKTRGAAEANIGSVTGGLAGRAAAWRGTERHHSMATRHGHPAWPPGMATRHGHPARPPGTATRQALVIRSALRAAPGAAALGCEALLEGAVAAALALDAAGGLGPGAQARLADWTATLLADAILALVEPLSRIG